MIECEGCWLSEIYNFLLLFFHEVFFWNEEIRSAIDAAELLPIYNHPQPTFSATCTLNPFRTYFSLYYLKEFFSEKCDYVLVKSSTPKGFMNLIWVSSGHSLFWFRIRFFEKFITKFEKNSVCFTIEVFSK